MTADMFSLLTCRVLLALELHVPHGARSVYRRIRAQGLSLDTRASVARELQRLAADRVIRKTNGGYTAR